MTFSSSPAEEIEIRDVVLFVWQARWWMLVGAGLFLLMAGGYLFLQPPKYTAEAWIQWRTTAEEGMLLPRISKGNLSAIVVSPTWWSVYVGEVAEGVEIDAEVVEGQPRLHLTVTAATPEAAYQWARRWSTAVVAWLQKRDERYLATLQQAIEHAQRAYTQAHQAYLTFLAQDPRPGLQARRAEVKELRDCALQRKRYFTFVLDDLQEAQALWKAQETLSPQDMLLYLTLQQRVFSGVPCGGSGDLVVQFGDAGVWGNLQPAEAATRLAQWTEYVQARLREEEQRLIELEKEWVGLQEQLEEAEEEADRLKAARAQARQHWERLEQEYRSVRIRMELQPIVDIEVPPALPERPQPRRATLLLAVSGVLGAFWGLVVFGLYRAMQVSKPRQEGMS